MEVRATLLPGDKGTNRLSEQYGDQLVCVRCRYDKSRKKRFTTIELIVAESEWQPGVRTPNDRVVSLRIGYGEQELRERVKEAGAFWDSSGKVWRLSYHETLRLGLEGRIDDGLGF